MYLAQDWWARTHIDNVRGVTAKCLRRLKKGRFSKIEMKELIQDILETPEPVSIRFLDRLQCKRLVAWLIYLGAA
jgi:hypothetical protein